MLKIYFVFFSFSNFIHGINDKEIKISDVPYELFENVISVKVVIKDPEAYKTE